MRWERESRLAEGIAAETPFYFVHSLRAAAERGSDVLGTAAYGERFACAAERGNVFGVQFHPEKSSAAGLPAALPTSPGRLRRRSPLRRVILYPAIDIRGGRAVRLVQGDYDRETALRRRPRRARPSGGSAKAPSSCTSSTSTARAAGSRRTSSEVDAGSSRRRACPVQVGGGLREAGRSQAVLGAGAERVVIGTAALARPGVARAASLADHGDRIVVSADARGGRIAPGAGARPGPAVVDADRGASAPAG